MKIKIDGFWCKSGDALKLLNRKCRYILLLIHMVAATSVFIRTPQSSIKHAVLRRDITDVDKFIVGVPYASLLTSAWTISGLSLFAYRLSRGLDC